MYVSELIVSINFFLEKPKEESLSYEESLAGSETSWTVQLLGKVSEAVSVPNEDESITKPCEESKGESLLVNLSSVSPCGMFHCKTVSEYVQLLLKVAKSEKKMG